MEIWKLTDGDLTKSPFLGAFPQHGSAIAEGIAAIIKTQPVGNCWIVFTKEEEGAVDEMAKLFLPECGPTRPCVFLEAILKGSWIRNGQLPQQFLPVSRITVAYVPEKMEKAIDATSDYRLAVWIHEL